MEVRAGMCLWLPHFLAFVLLGLISNLARFYMRASTDVLSHPLGHLELYTSVVTSGAAFPTFVVLFLGGSSETRVSIWYLLQREN